MKVSREGFRAGFSTFFIIATAVAILPWTVGAETGASSGAGAIRDLAAPERAMWVRASELWTAGIIRKPALGRYSVNELSVSGKILSHEEGEMAFTYLKGPDKPETEYLHVVKDGVDVTEERRAGKARGFPGGPGSGNSGARNADSGGTVGSSGAGALSFPDPVPFAASRIGSMLPGLKTPLAGGGFWQDYVLSGKPAVRGKVRFGSDGTPMELEYTLDPLPAFTSVLRGKLYFSGVSEGFLVIDSMSFRIEAGFLILKKRYSFELAFSDYRQVVP